MKLSIDIDDAELNEVITNGIKELSNETITDLAKEALNSYLQTNDGIEGIIYRGKRNAWDPTPELRPEIVQMLQNSFDKEEVEVYRAKIFKALEERGGDLMIKVLAEVFSRFLMTEDTKRDIAYSLSRIASMEHKY